MSIDLDRTPQFTLVRVRDRLSGLRQMRTAALEPLRIAIALLALAAAAQAQPRAFNGTPPIRNYMVRDYGGRAQVWTILRDRRGLLYTGQSDSYVYQYDGAVWRKIPIPSNVVRTLAEDSDGRIWVGAAGDFGYLEPDSAGA